MEKKIEEEYNFSKYRIIIPEELDHLIKGFLSRRSQEVRDLESLVSDDRWEELTRLGHKIKGHGSGFGFEGISLIGEKIETSAKSFNKEKLVSHANEYSSYLVYLDNILSEAYNLKGKN